MNYKKEAARDIIALGSIIFYLLVLIRAISLQHLDYIYRLLFAIIILFPLSKIIKNSNPYIARGIVLAVFVSLYYQSVFFAIFASLLMAAMILSLKYLRVKKTSIVRGILAGILATGISYYLVMLII